MRLENPKATNGYVKSFGVRPGQINPNVMIRYVEVETLNDGVKFFEITKANWSPFEGVKFQEPWEKIHQVSVGEFVLIIHGDANRNDMGRELFIGYAVEK